MDERKEMIYNLHLELQVSPAETFYNLSPNVLFRIKFPNASHLCYTLLTFNRLKEIGIMSFCPLLVLLSPTICVYGRNKHYFLLNQIFIVGCQHIPLNQCAVSQSRVNNYNNNRNNIHFM